MNLDQAMDISNERAEALRKRLHHLIQMKYTPFVIIEKIKKDCITVDEWCYVCFELGRAFESAEAELTTELCVN